LTTGQFERRITTVIPVRRSLQASIVAGLLLAAAGSVAGQSDPVDLDLLLARVGGQLERYFQRSQRIVSTETVLVRSFDRAMQLSGLPRRLKYERRVEWDAVGEDGVPTVTVVRELRSVNGRDARPDDENPCLAPESEVDHPLSVLLPARRSEFEFSLRELERIDGRLVARVAYVPVETRPGEVEWEAECTRISIDSWYGGDAWVDVESGDILRLDTYLTRQFEFREPLDRPRASMRWSRLERDDTTIRYERVAFEDPAETLVLPRSIERSWAIEGGGFVPRYYRSQRFSDYRRFITEGRLVGGTERPAPAP
jgi:hypothetical protein